MGVALPRLDVRVRILAGWMAAVAATQAWLPWSDQVREKFASDTTSYIQIADAAPHLPASPIASHHAERFASHWLVGTIAHETGAGVHDVYRAGTLLCLLAMLLVLHRTFVRLALEPGAYALCLGVVVASAYPMRYLLAAPGMLSDAVFLLGLSIFLLGFVAERPAVLLAGLAVATLGRQTAVPLAVAATLVLALRRPRTRRSLGLAVSATGVAAALFLGEWLLTRGFSRSEVGALSSFSVLGALPHPVQLADHLGRVALGSMLPLALVAGAFRVHRRPFPWGAALFATAVAGQAAVLGPEWAAHNEPRLAGLGAPALAVSAALLLRRVRLAPAVAALGSVVLFVASLHPRYSDAALPSTLAWALAEAVGGAVLVLVLPGGMLPERGAVNDVGRDGGARERPAP